MNDKDLVAEFMAFITNRGMCVTPQRRVIAEAFFSFPGHHTSEEFYHHVSALDSRIGQTTVYRTLKLLCAAGLASEIQFSDNVARYEVADTNSHHDHLICLGCGRVEEVYDRRIEAIQRELAANHGFTLQGHSHNLYGYCSECREKESSSVATVRLQNYSGQDASVDED